MSSPSVPLGPDDVEAVLALEARSSARPWTRTAVLGELEGEGRQPWGVAGSEGWVAWLALRFVVDEAWIHQVLVDPAARRQGLGGVLVERGQASARAWRVPLWLEVREGNVAARALYAGRGFVEVARRPGYYPPDEAGAPREAAVLYRWSP